jgi:hypothetical protein
MAADMFAVISVDDSAKEIIAAADLGRSYIGSRTGAAFQQSRRCRTREPVVSLQNNVINALRSAKQLLRCFRPALTALAAVILMATPPARAVYGCLVLLCLAAPSWSAIPQCVPPVTQVLRDLARGRPFPTCAMSGAGNSGNHQWASAPGNCPPQYTYAMELENGVAYSCGYTGVVSIQIDGAPWSRTWWTGGGQTVTDFSASAKARMGSLDTKYDDDYAAWVASLPPPAEPCAVC